MKDKEKRQTDSRQENKKTRTEIEDEQIKRVKDRSTRKEIIQNVNIPKKKGGNAKLTT